jgi:hypothetical protein
VRRILRGARLASPQKRRPRKYRARRLPRPRCGMMALTTSNANRKTPPAISALCVP